MKSLVWLVTLSLLVLGIYCGSMIPAAQTAQAATLTEGSFPAPEMHKGSPEKLAAERGEGSYPTPACGPENPRCKPFVVEPKLQAGEGSYPTPSCGPENPRCKPFVTQPKLQAGEGSYPTPGCGPENPRCKPFVKQPRTVAMLAEGAAPAPFEVPA
ncbi:MAG TPA: hypothetical protein VF135_07955, partial [Terriglobales bacterium]